MIRPKLGSQIPNLVDRPIGASGGLCTMSGYTDRTSVGKKRRNERVRAGTNVCNDELVLLPLQFLGMTAPGPTIKSFHKRLYTVLPRGIAVPRIRSNSAGASSRALHSYPSLPYCDPSTPPPSSRPGNPHLLSTTRLPIEARTEPEAPNSSQSTGPTPPSSLALTSPQSSNSSSSSLNGVPLSNFNAPPFFLYQPFIPPSSLPSAASDASRHRFHFDVGAYGIPKRHPSSIDPGRDVAGDAEVRSHNLKSRDGLDLAVQVGEDSFFVRDNAMGVADGVGGWSRTRTSVLEFSHLRPTYAHIQIRRKAPLLHRRFSLDA